ncbi:MAG: GNAT family N-acetyltransferase [Candidatus Acidiferrales bacterium]
MISFRDATAADADAVAQLINTAFIVEQFFIERDRTNPETVRRLMNIGKFLLAEDGPNLVACIYLELRGERGYFGMLSVEPARQRIGVGRQLIAASEKYFRDAGCRFSDLKIVDVRTELLALYQRLGYVQTGTAVYDDPVPTKMPVHFILMSKHLA